MHPGDLAIVNKVTTDYLSFAHSCERRLIETSQTNSLGQAVTRRELSLDRIPCQEIDEIITETQRILQLIIENETIRRFFDKYGRQEIPKEILFEEIANLDDEEASGTLSAAERAIIEPQLLKIKELLEDEETLQNSVWPLMEYASSVQVFIDETERLSVTINNDNGMGMDIEDVFLNGARMAYAIIYLLKKRNTESFDQFFVGDATRVLTEIRKIVPWLFP